MTEDQRLEALSYLSGFEERFDRAQGGIRRAASLWLLAVFAAQGYFFSLPPESGALAGDLDGIEYLFPDYVLAEFFFYLGCLAILLLWMLDQLVYQRLLHAVFTLGLRLEAKDPTGIEARLAMYRSSGNVNLSISLFYFGPALVLLGFGIMLHFGFPGPSYTWPRLIMMVITVLLFLVAIYKATRNDIVRRHAQDLNQDLPALRPGETLSSYLKDLKG